MLEAVLLDVIFAMCRGDKEAFEELAEKWESARLHEDAETTLSQRY